MFVFSKGWLQYIIKVHVHFLISMMYIFQTGLYLLSTLDNMDAIRATLQTYYKFVISRNPYSRLYSGYTDKFINHTQSSRYRDDILQLFPDAPVYGRHAQMTFQQFLMALTGTAPNVSQTVSSDFRNSLMRDVHFRTQLAHCHPCLIEYDYIAAVETMDSSIPLMELFNVSSLPELNKSHKDLNGIVSLEEGLSSMPEETTNELLNLYRYDFELFGYSPDEDNIRRKEWCDMTENEV